MERKDLSEFGLGEILASNGFEIEAVEDRAWLISHEEWPSTFEVFIADSWVQFASRVVEADEQGPRALPAEVCRMLLRFHQRFLGCRLCLEDDGAVSLRADVSAASCSADLVMEALGQIQWVGGVMCEALAEVVQSGVVLSDDDIDQLFDE